MKKIKLIALCGQAGAGKDTLLSLVVQECPELFSKVIGCTTRPRREKEIDGVDYQFLSIDEFTQKLLSGDMIEASEFRDWHYGTLRSALSIDKINIGIFNPTSIDYLKADSSIDLLIVEIKCSDKERLLRQLDRECDPDIDEIIRRYQTDKTDFADFEADYVYMNERDGDDKDFPASLVNFLQFLGFEI